MEEVRCLLQSLEYAPDASIPATAEVIAEVELASGRKKWPRWWREAKAAYPAWRETPAPDRIQYLFKFKQLLEEHYDEIARIITEENGKTLAEAKAELRARD